MLQIYCVDVAGAPTPFIFFLKLQGDIYRYMAEVSIAEEASKYKDLCEQKYVLARNHGERLTSQRINEGDGDKIGSLRLSLNLNYAIFLFEQKDEKKEALRILKREIQEALDDFDKWKEDEVEEIKKQVELIQENINLWKEDVDTDSDEEN